MCFFIDIYIYTYTLYTFVFDSIFIMNYVLKCNLYVSFPSVMHDTGVLSQMYRFCRRTVYLTWMYYLLQSIYNCRQNNDVYMFVFVQCGLFSIILLLCFFFPLFFLAFFFWQLLSLQCIVTVYDLEFLMSGLILLQFCFPLFEFWRHACFMHYENNIGMCNYFVKTFMHLLSCCEQVMNVLVHAFAFFL